mmetsp:Transcript_39740/g.94382  ORF Transcript_39740/g.94382 Transcript_39740/m.94382 type:complete len:158 (+) Transcript_39740:3336-3809(+)
MKRRSCVTMTTDADERPSHPSIHRMTSRSMWFVGSSRRISPGSDRTAEASATLLLCPPDMSATLIDVSQMPRDLSTSSASDLSSHAPIASMVSVHLSSTALAPRSPLSTALSAVSYSRSALDASFSMLRSACRASCSSGRSGCCSRNPTFRFRFLDM